jgi:16S rRNA (cytidine1402-2'-O)-methyltransferase
MFNEFARRDATIQRLKLGGILALISDAGMPGISDPGTELVCMISSLSFYDKVSFKGGNWMFKELGIVYLVLGCDFCLLMLFPVQVKACVESNVRVHPIPGASTVITTLVASGLPTDEFTFGEKFFSLLLSLGTENVYTLWKLCLGNVVRLWFDVSLHALAWD